MRNSNSARITNIKPKVSLPTKAKGVQFGRPPKDRPQSLAEIAKHWKNGDISGRTAAQQLGVAFATFKLWAANVEMRDQSGNILKDQEGQPQRAVWDEVSFYADTLVSLRLLPGSAKHFNNIGFPTGQALPT